MEAIDHMKARDVSLNLRNASDHMRDFALLKSREIDGIDWRLYAASDSVKAAADLLGFDLVKRQPAPVTVSEPEVFNDPRNERAA
jgi:hypothetical protein